MPVGVRVVHRHRLLVGGELVGEGLARLDEWLGDRRHPVVGVGDVDSVPVDVGGDGQLVEHPHLDAVTDLELQHRRRHHPVEGPRLDHVAGGDLPVAELHGEVEHLGAVVEDLGGLEHLVADAFGLLGELGKRLQHGGGHGGEVHVVAGPATLGRGLAFTEDGQLGLHPRLAVPGDGAEDRVGARLEVGQLQVGHVPGVEVGRDQLGAVDGEVVEDLTLVHHVDGAADLGGGGSDRELGHRHRGAAGGHRRGTAGRHRGGRRHRGTRSVRGNRRFVARRRPDGEPDGDGGPEHGERRQDDGDDGQPVAATGRCGGGLGHGADYTEEGASGDRGEQRPRPRRRNQPRRPCRGAPSPATGRGLVPFGGVAAGRSSPPETDRGVTVVPSDLDGPFMGVHDHSRPGTLTHLPGELFDVLTLLQHRALPVSSCTAYAAVTSACDRRRASAPPVPRTGR